MTHIFRLADSLQHEWELAERHPVLATCALSCGGENGRIFLTKPMETPKGELPEGETVSSWRVREFPGCSIVAVTTDVWVSDRLRGKGVGSWLRDLRTRACKRAGFRAEMCTVRTDNPAQEAIMRHASRPVVELPSDRGGTIRMWLMELGRDTPGTTTCTEHGHADCQWCELWNRAA